MTTFTTLLGSLLGKDPGRPLVTYYDHATGERVELSVTTYANWVTKAASLLAEEHDLERGQGLHLDLPTHWLGPVFLGAAWTVGLVVTTADRADAVVCGPEGLATWGERAADLPVLACSLLPMGVRFAEPLPPGVHDVGIEVWSQPDAFTAWDPPGPDDLALPGVTQAELWRTAAAGSLLTDGGRSPQLGLGHPGQRKVVVARRVPGGEGIRLRPHLDPDVVHARRQRLGEPHAHR